MVCAGTGRLPSEQLAQAMNQPDDELAAALVAAGEQLVGTDGLLAVRSSGVDEDGGSHSFAGQFDSYLAALAKCLTGRLEIRLERALAIAPTMACLPWRRRCSSG